MKNGNRRWVVASLVALSGAVLAERPAAAFEFVVSPWTGSSSQVRTLTCGNCSLLGGYGALRNSTLANGSVGTYQMVLKGTPYTGAKISVHVTALGVPGASCNPYYAVRNNTEYVMNIGCQKAGVPTNSRFMVDILEATNSTWAGKGFAFARVQANALTTDTYSTSGQAPTMTHPSVGVYNFNFPGLSDMTSGGNAQALSTSFNKHCSLTGWGTSYSGSFATVACYDAYDSLVDSDVMVQYQQSFGSSVSGFVWADQPSATSTYTPNPTWNRGVGDIAGTNTPMKITRQGTGRYLVDVGLKGAYASGSTGIRAQVTPWGTTATCNVLGADMFSVLVSCSNRFGTPVDAYFSLQYRTDHTYYTPEFRQVPPAGTNFYAIFDVGHGLACGTSPTQAGVNCVVPTGKFATSDVAKIVSGYLPASSVKSIAVANVDATATKVLALGNDNVVYATSGTLGPTWDVNNFKLWSWFAEPVTTTGAVLTLKKIVAVRSTAANGVPYVAIVGLTTGGKTYMIRNPNDKWAQIALTGNLNSTFVDIGHGRDDLYAIMSDRTMWYANVADGTYRQLPALPNGLAPIAIGGRFVMTNAGKSGSSYPCYAPKDSQGYYNCPGASKRLYRLLLDNTWMPVLSSPAHSIYEPTQNTDDVLTMGDPLAAGAPTVIDGEAFDGSYGSVFVWQYFSRIYQLAP